MVPLLFLPPFLLADFPALEIFAARVLLIPLRFKALYFAGCLMDEDRPPLLELLFFFAAMYAPSFGRA